MKSVFSILIAIVFSLNGWTQFEFGVGYNLMRPTGEMATTVPSVHSIAFHSFYAFPNTPVMLGFDLSAGLHGYESSDVLFTFEDNTSTTGNMTISNSLFQTGLSIRLELMQDVALRPYVSGRVGLAYFGSSLAIEDKTNYDPEYSSELYREQMSSDLNVVYGLGAGLRYDLGDLFGGLEGEHLYLDMGLHRIFGDDVDHMSVRAHERTGGTDELFLHPDTPTIEFPWYEGRIYRTPFDVYEFRFKLIYRI